jgi:hypothetical protein
MYFQLQSLLAHTMLMILSCSKLQKCAFFRDPGGENKEDALNGDKVSYQIRINSLAPIKSN